MWHKPCQTFHPWCPCIKTRCLSEVRGGIWTPFDPVLLKISANKRPLNQLIVKNLLFHYSSKHFALNTIILFMKKWLIWVSWMKEICTLLVKLHIIFSRMQRVNQHARPSIIQVGCPTCCYEVPFSLCLWIPCPPPFPLRRCQAICRHGAGHTAGYFSVKISVWSCTPRNPYISRDLGFVPTVHVNPFMGP